MTDKSADKPAVRPQEKKPAVAVKPAAVDDNKPMQSGGGQSTSKLGS